MNSKELLLKAREAAEKQLKLAGQIEHAEETIDAAKEGKICFYLSGVGAMSIDSVVDADKLTVVKDMALTAIMNYRDDRTRELEKLLGIRKPATINPEFEEATKDMFDAVKKGMEDKSLDKYPAKKTNKSNYPEGMTVKAVSDLYINQGMSGKQIAEYFSVTPTQVNTFLNTNKLFRGSYKKPDKKECPLQG